VKFAKVPVPIREFLIASFFFLAGCATNKPIYHWGSYETLTYAQLVKPEKISPEEQLLHLEEDLEKAKSKDLSPPPGMCAYMGYLYLEIGDNEKGRHFFEQEQVLFPESKPFVQVLLEKTSPQPIVSQ